MSLGLEARKAALVLIDLEHGIVSMPVQPYTADEVVRTCRELAAAFRSRGGTVVYVRIDLADTVPLVVDRSYSDPRRSVIPAEASELVPEAGFEKGDLLMTKRHWSAFGQTELEQALRVRGIETIVLAGIATNFGVESTARQAVALGFQVVIAEDACSSLGTEMHEFVTQQIFPLLGRVRSAQEVIDALG